MGMLVWVMMGLAIWHFTVFLPGSLLGRHRRRAPGRRHRRGPDRADHQRLHDPRAPRHAYRDVDRRHPRRARSGSPSCTSRACAGTTRRSICSFRASRASPLSMAPGTGRGAGTLSPTSCAFAATTSSPSTSGDDPEATLRDYAAVVPPADVVVGHSMAGLTIPLVDAPHRVYLCAFVPKWGHATRAIFAEGALLPGFPDNGITRDERGRSVWVDDEFALSSMYADCDRVVALQAYALLRPQASGDLRRRLPAGAAAGPAARRTSSAPRTARSPRTGAAASVRNASAWRPCSCTAATRRCSRVPRTWRTCWTSWRRDRGSLRPGGGGPLRRRFGGHVRARDRRASWLASQASPCATAGPPGHASPPRASARSTSPSGNARSATQGDCVTVRWSCQCREPWNRASRSRRAASATPGAWSASSG